MIVLSSTSHRFANQFRSIDPSFFTIAMAGGLFGSFQRRGMADMYQPTPKKFFAWLDFMLDPQQATRLGQKFGRLSGDTIRGPVTQRMLMVTLIDPIQLINSRPSEAKVMSDLSTIVSDCFAIMPESSIS